MQPLLMSMPCIEYAEHYAQDKSQAADYYLRALSVAHRDKACRGLMNIYQGMNRLRDAKRYGDAIHEKDSDDEEDLNRLCHGVNALEIRIPRIAEGYENDYRLFLSGKLIYRPDPMSNRGKIEMRIADLSKPLDGVFDLSSCGEAGQLLSINTGYRKMMRAENRHKCEFWFVPKFVVEIEIEKRKTGRHFFLERIQKWTAPVGLIWNMGSDDLECYNYLTTKYEPGDVINTVNNSLYEQTYRGNDSTTHTPIFLKPNTLTRISTPKTKAAKLLSRFTLVFFDQTYSPDNCDEFLGFCTLGETIGDPSEKLRNFC